MPDNKKTSKDIFISKKYFSGAKDNDKVVFRPLHSSSLLDQITAVAMLNILFIFNGSCSSNGLRR